MTDSDDEAPLPAGVDAARDRIGRARTLTPDEMVTAPTAPGPVIRRSGFRLAESDIGRYVASLAKRRP